MLPLWMKAFGAGDPLKLQPAKAVEQTATNAAHKVAPATARRNIRNSPTSEYEDQARISCEWIFRVKD
jgi:hypothetical protein